MTSVMLQGKLSKICSHIVERLTIILECARKEYNHYEGMRYPSGDIQLVSTYWIKSKYKNEWFTIHPIMKKVHE